MKMTLLTVLIAGGMQSAARAETPSHAKEIDRWRTVREEKLRADNGWLTLAGRYALKEGANTFGTGKGNDVVFPKELQATGPEQLGTIHVDPKAKAVTLKLTKGVSMVSGDTAFAGERALASDSETRDWVGLGRFRMHIIERGGRFYLRLADNESQVRKDFRGCVWYPPNEAYKVQAKFVAGPAGETLPIVNVNDEVSKQPSPGYVEFSLQGETIRLDALQDGDALLIVFRDATAGDTTYKPGRFLAVDTRPKPGELFPLDFNKAYNPPCAFSRFTTCPLPPPRNVIKSRIEAGEKLEVKP